MSEPWTAKSVLDDLERFNSVKGAAEASTRLQERIGKEATIKLGIYLTDALMKGVSPEDLKLAIDGLAAQRGGS